MDNVNQLNRTSGKNISAGIGPKEDLNATIKLSRNNSISLSALDKEYPDGPITVDATTGDVKKGGVEMSITPPKKKIVRRTASEASSIKEIDMNDLQIDVQKQLQPNAAGKIKNDAYNALDDRISKKIDEYHEFVDKAIALDKEHREKIEDGIETVNDHEVIYRPDDVLKNAKKARGIVDEDTIEDDVDSDLFDEDKIDTTYIDNDEIETPVVVKSLIEEEDYNMNDDIKINDIEDIDDDSVYIDQDFEYDDSDNYDTEEVNTYDDVDNDYENPIEDNNEEETTEEDNIEVEVKFPIKKEEPVNSVAKELFVGSKTIESLGKINTEDVKNSSTESFDVDDDDFDDVSEGTDSTLSDNQVEEIRKASDNEFRSEILNKIIMTGKKLNINSFAISNKVIDVKDAIRKRNNDTNQEVAKIGRFPLMNAGRLFEVSPLKGPELVTLGSSNNIDRTGLDIIYKHDMNPNKPSTLEGWAKTIPTSDFDYLFGAIYDASIIGANYIPMECTVQACQHKYLTDDLGLKEYIKFPNDKIKEKFNRIMNSGSYTGSGTYDSILNPINDRFAVSLKLPSMYNLVFEARGLNREFIDKYRVIIDILSCVDHIYILDEADQTIKPIGWKTFPGDIVKTYKSKIATYSKIIKEFSSYDYQMLVALVNTILEESAESEKNKITFEIPKGICPKCGAEIPASEWSTVEAVFIRQRLVDFATIS